MPFRPAFQYFNTVLDPQGSGQFAPYWQKALTDLLNRIMTQGPVWTGSVQFTGVPAQTSHDFVVQFPAGSVPQNTACVAMCSPVPPANSCFTAHVAAGDQVVIRFNNYSSGTLGTGVPQFFSLMILPKGN